MQTCLSLKVREKSRMFGRKIMTLPVFLQATQMARAWVGCVAMVCEFLKTEPGLLSSALTPTP